MPRPQQCRRVISEPNVTYFKPAGVHITDLEVITVTVDEYEAIRLKDSLNMDQNVAAKKMCISQPTFHRLITEARKKIADAVVNGKAIKITGGNFKLAETCKGCHKLQK